MLFYYFGSKMELYHELLRVLSEKMQVHAERLIESAKGLDVLEILCHATRMKLEAYAEEPATFDFLSRLYLHPEDTTVSEDARAYFQRLLDTREQMVYALFSQADRSQFRRDIPTEQLMRYLNWMIEGYTQELMQILKTTGSFKLSEMETAPYWAEFDRYIADWKKLFYAE